MKQVILHFIAILGIVGVGRAQSVTEQELSMSLGRQTAFYIEIDGADEDMVEDVWKEFSKDFGKSKKNKKASEVYIIDAKVPAIAGSNPIDIYTKIDERVNQTTMYMWVDLHGNFANSNESPKEARGIEDLLTQFYFEVKKSVIGKELKENEKQLSSLDKDLRKLEKKNTSYHEDIENAKQKIIEAEKNIEQNLKDQEDQRIKIEQQKKIVEEIIERLNNLGKTR